MVEHSLSVLPEVVLAIYDHAVSSYPRECCGLVLGRRSGPKWTALEAYRANNLAPASRLDRYELDPGSRLEAERQAKAQSLSVVGFYHSHPDHDAYFSATDLQHSEEYLLGEPWVEPTYAYIVCSIRQGRPAGIGAFLVENGLSREIAIEEIL